MRNAPLRTLALLGLVLAMVLSACGPAATAPAATTASAAPATAAATAAPSAAPTATPPPVQVAMGVAQNITNAAIFLGIDKGIFLKNGLDVKFNTAAAGTDVFKALQAGQYQAAVTAWSVVAPAVSAGVAVKVFGLVTGGSATAYDNQLPLVLGPGVNATTINDLKGKTIASVLGTTPEIWLRTRLRAAGLDPDKDVKIASVPYANMLGVLQTKAADAAIPVEPYGSLIINKLPGTKVLFRGGGIVDGRQILVATPQWLQQNPKVVDSLLKANFEAAQYLRQHPDEGAQSALRYLDGLDVQSVSDALKQLAYDPRWADTVVQGFDKTSDLLVAAGTIKTAPKASEVVALDLLNSWKTYPQFFTDLK